MFRIKSELGIIGLMFVLLLVGCSSPSTPEPSPTNPPESAPENETTTDSAEAPAQTNLQWNPEPIVVTNLGGDQAIPRIVAGNKDDFYIAWFSNPNGENYDVRMQRFDGQGNAQWEENGRIISDQKSNSWISDYVFTRDDAGNLILVFQDIRTGTSNIFAYKLSPDGENLWGADGLQITNIEGFAAPFPTTVITSEHITFSWIEESSERRGLVVQRVAPDGTKLWGENGLFVPGQETEFFEQGVVAFGGDEDLIVVYGVEKQAGSQEMAIYAQKLDKNGNSIWNDGNPILLHESVPIYLLPQLVSDGADGAYIAWYTTDLRGFVQHIDAAGNLTMPAEGAPMVTNTTNLQIAPVLQFLPEREELSIFWVDTDERQSERGVSGQKMSPTGELLWGENGRNYVPLSRAEVSQVTPRLSADNIVVFYMQGEAAEDSNVLASRLLALLVDSNGEPVWPEPNIITPSLTEKSDLEVAVIQGQNWITVWADGLENKENEGREILMQNLSLQSVDPN